MSRFIITENGYSVAWAPTFTSKAEAEAWLSERSEGSFDGRVEIDEEEGYCEHGTYVGEVMEDLMCGYCEA